MGNKLQHRYYVSYRNDELMQVIKYKLVNWASISTRKIAKVRQSFKVNLKKNPLEICQTNRNNRKFSF